MPATVTEGPRTARAYTLCRLNRLSTSNPRTVRLLPYFIIERSFAEAITLPFDAQFLNEVNDEEDVRWIFSYLALDRTHTYCLYEAPSAEAIRLAADRAGIPADAITEVAGRVLPTGQLTGAE